MTVCRVLTRLLLLAPLALWLAGCSPWGDNPADEEKDPHFLAGNSRLSSMDYEGAISAFESALVSNPSSAAAHLKLGFLYEEHKPNGYAAAIYHFERHLELKPQSNMAETVRQHVLACKLELAKTVPFALVNRQVQDELRRLYTSNSALHEQVDLLKTQLVEQAVAYSNRLAQVTQAALQAQARSPASAPAPAPAPSDSERRRLSSRSGPTLSSATAPPARSSATPRVHVVKAGETLASISKRYNIRLSSLQAANPSVDAYRLRAGQTLVLPVPKEGRF